MSRQRIIILGSLAALTLIFFSAAAYTFFGNRIRNRDQHTIDPLPLGEVPAALRIRVTEAGIITISADQLDESHLPIDEISQETLSLSRDGEAVPFHVSGEGRDRRLIFYGQVVTDSLEAPAVYWLEPGQGLPMEQREARPITPAADVGVLSKRWEENEIFLAQASGDDVWLGKLLFAPSSLDVPLNGIMPTGGPGKLTVQIWSNNQARNDPDHHVELLLNGNRLTDHYWDGIKQERIEIEIPAGILDPEENHLTITAPGDTGAAGEALYVDWIELAYEGLLELDDGVLVFTSSADNIMAAGATNSSQVFDITDPDHPVILMGADIDRGTIHFAGNGQESRYLVLNEAGDMLPEITLVPERLSLTDAGRGADYIAIVADGEDFQEALEPLLDYRESQGLSVESVPVAQVFDEFGHGRATPQAIRDFLHFAVANWEPSPRFALLVGDASYDLRDYTNGKNKNLLPTYLVYTEYAGYVASDTWFTIFAEDSLAPQISIGRFPAQTTDQLSTMVNKTIEYEKSADPDWISRALLVADDEPAFDEASENLAQELDRIGYQTQKLYMSENENIHDAIVSALNQGVGVINYVGHGSIEVWGDERVFQADDADILINRQRLPVFTTFTCLNGYFNHPDVDALAETLIWAEDGGVVAAIAPSGRSLTNQQLPLADAFFERILSDDLTTLGEALQMAKASASGDDFLSDVIHTFNLLGDPALRFHSPRGMSG